MPRPGPRPYECVRRAWHSDRHHPVRGSVIQEIFRIVNEVHCVATRKNREWQEKLPIVVLKAEEIMYSKANSEVEYSDLKTLWHRVEDAINTIIRKDEDTETGELLQPCIEAALLLGCTPRRSSRSQRNDSPRYLRSEFPGATSIPPINSCSKFYRNHTASNPLMFRYAQYMTPTSSSFHSSLKFEHHLSQDMKYINEKSPIFPNRYDLCDNHHTSIQTVASSNTLCIYPLLNNDQIRSFDLAFHTNETSNSHSHFVDANIHGVQQNLFPDGLCDSSDKIRSSGNGYSCDKECGVSCDLTLRLGSLAVPCTSIERRPHEA